MSNINFRITNEPRKRLDDLMAYYSLNQTSTILLLIAQAHQKAFPHKHRLRIMSEGQTKKLDDKAQAERRLPYGDYVVEGRGYYGEYRYGPTGPNTIGWLDPTILGKLNLGEPSRFTNADMLAWANDFPNKGQPTWDWEEGDPFFNSREIARGKA